MGPKDPAPRSLVAVVVRIVAADVPLTVNDSLPEPVWVIVDAPIGVSPSP